MAKGRSVRRTLFPLWELQGRIIVIVCVALLLATVVVGVFQTWFFLSFVRGLGVEMGEQGRDREFVAIASSIAVIEVLIFLPFFVLIAAVVTRRIVGPLKRLPRDFRAIGEGDLVSPIRFRQRDSIHFIAHAAQDMKDVLARRISSCQEMSANVLVAVEEMKAAGPDGISAERLASVHAEAVSLHAKLNTFDSDVDGGA